jgi:hypothetical protein
MSQQASDLPRSVQIIGRYRALIGLVVLLGAFAGIVFGALNPPTSTSRALVVFTAPTCPDGAICGGPMFSPGYFQAMVLKEFPGGVQVKPVAGGVVSISVAAGTAARAEALANAAARRYIADTGSVTYMGEHATAQILQPATTTVTGMTPLKQLAGDALAGAALGALLGIIAALAGAQTIIDPPTLPREVGVTDRETGPQTGGLTLQQLAREYAERTPAPGSPFDV